MDTYGVGPIDWLVIELPVAGMTGEAWTALTDLVDRGIVRVLDFALLAKGEDGSVTAVQMDDPLAGTMSLAVFVGASSGLLGDDDLAEAAQALDPGRAAAVLLYENSWAVPMVDALRRAGAQAVSTGRIPVADIVAALERTEA